MAIYQAMPWHQGENLMHEKLRAPTDNDNPTAPMLSQQAARTLQYAPLLAIGTIDDQARPWTSIWGGEAGFSRSLGHDILGIRTPVAATFDPVVETLVGRKPDGGIVKEEGRGRMVGGLTLDLGIRKRVKLYGRMVAGALSTVEPENSDEDKDAVPETEIQLVLKIEQSLGNCPKYAATKQITAAPAVPRLVSDSPHLIPEAVSLIHKSDMFFVSSRQEMTDMDTNYRGGPAGFVRVMSDEASTTIIWPEYSGNRLYQTLGNLQVTPLAGLCFPDFATGDVLYLTGTTEILIGPDAANVLPRSNLAVKLRINAARFVSKGLPFRGTVGEPSPYNPPVRYLTTERPPAEATDQTPNSATLIRQIRLTPNVSRFHFSLKHPSEYTAGQYVTFDFSSHLNMGYSHMRDDDPLSINDDFVRTFTVSNPPNSSSNSPQATANTTFDITIRKVGPATSFLFKHGLEASRSHFPLEVDVKGFGGSFRVTQEGSAETVGFIAGGVGITPLLPAFPDLDPNRLVVLWALRRNDLSLAVDMLTKYPTFAKSVRIFVTGPADQAKDSEAATAEREVLRAGASVTPRRLRAEDVRGADVDSIQRWFLCTNTSIREDLLKWLPGKETIYEDFNF